MTPDDINSCFSLSPAFAALAGSLVGAFTTGCIALLQFRHTAKENQKAWERQETSRKEERFFEKKAKAYEEFFEAFDVLSNINRENFRQVFAPIAFKIALYSPPHIKECVREIYDANIKIIKMTDKNEDFHKETKKTYKLFKKMRDLMIEDIKSHILTNDNRKS